MILENIRMALASLQAAKLRSFLTMLGIIIGIAAVVSINAIGEGVKKSVTNQITGLGTNIISITSGKSISTDKNGKKTISPSASIGASTLTQKDVETVQNTPHITVAAPLMLISGIVGKDQKTATNALLVATTPDFYKSQTGKIDNGAFFTTIQNDDNVVVLGSAVKEQLFDAADALDQSIMVRGEQFKVIGIMKSQDTGASSLGGGGGVDDIVYIPVGAATKLTGGNLQILRIFTQVDTSENVNPAADKLKAELLANHGGQEDFSVLTQADLVSTVSGILDILATFIAAIASIALLVGGIGIMNIMLVNVTERTREIGIRKALGANRAMILTQFLIEAVVLSLMGGLLGCLAAIGMANLAGNLAKITPAFSIRSFAIAFGVSAAIGIIFGLMPAFKAARKRPIEALRYE